MEIVKRLDRKLAYRGAVLNVYTDTVVANGITEKWDYIEHIGAAAVLPVLPDGRIVLVRQYRNALDRFTLELPAGKRDAVDEPMEECAARELEEETGYHSDKLELLITVNTTVAFCNEKIGIYIARDLVKTQQNLDEDEDLEVEIYTPRELAEMCYSGRMTDAKTVAAIMAYLNKYGQ